MLKQLIRKGFHAIGYEILRRDNPCLQVRPPAPGDSLRPLRIWLHLMDVHTVLDIGGHVGETALAYHQCLPNARVYSFEPEPGSFQNLLANTRGIRQIQAFNFALGDHAGPHTFFKSAFAPSSSLLRMGTLHKEMFPFTSDLKEETVEVRRLDDVAPELDLEPTVLLKLDVQGFERNVLLGAQKTLSQVKIVVAEAAFQALYEGQTEFAELYDLLVDQGFRFLGPIGHVTKNEENGLALFCDVLFGK